MSSPLMAATSVSAALAMGMAAVLFKHIEGPLAARLQLPQGRLERFHLLLLLSWVPLMPLAGWLVDRWGPAHVLFVGSLGLSLAVASLGLCQKTTSLFWAVLGLGIAVALVSTAGVVFMPLALTPTPATGRGAWSVGASICLGYVFVGLAMFLTPSAFAWCTRQVGFARALLLLALLCLVPATLVSLVSTGNPDFGLPVARNGALFDLRFWLILLVALLYFPLEFSLDIWPRPYLTDIGYADRSLIRLLIGFWCAFLVMRFGLGWIVRPGNEAWLMLVLALLSSMVVGNLAGAYGQSSGCLGFWMVGACYGALLPCLLAILLQWQGPRGAAGQATGVLFAPGRTECRHHAAALQCLFQKPPRAGFHATTHVARPGHGGAAPGARGPTLRQITSFWPDRLTSPSPSSSPWPWPCGG